MHPPAAELPLSGRLRADTQVLHRQAEGARFIQALLGGRLDTAAYALMLRNLQPIYLALEAGLRAHAGHPAIRPVLAPALFRGDALDEDLTALQGAGWEHALPLMPSAQAYARRLEMLATSDPALLTAHAYVRYLGDLNGGQLFARLVTRLLERAGQVLPARLRFHDFGPPADVARLAGALRSGLDKLAGGDGQAQRIVAEAVHAFGQHVVLFDELAAASGLAEAPLSPGR